MFGRRGTLSVIGGWREATAVGFYGIGTDNTSKDDRANYSFKQPYASAMLDVRPWRKALIFGGGVEYSEWDQGPGDGTDPSVDEVYTPATLPGLGATVTYLHTQGTVALDWRTSAGYSRRGGYYGATIHDYGDPDEVYSFRQVDYDAIQHLPLFRDRFVLSLHGRVETTYTNGDDTIPFFMLPALGGGLEPARLRELAVPRPSQPAPPGRMARARQQLLGHGALLRRRQGHRSPRGPLARRLEDRLWDWLSFAWSRGDTTARRVREEQRGAGPRLFGEGRVLRRLG